MDSQESTKLVQAVLVKRQEQPQNRQATDPLCFGVHEGTLLPGSHSLEIPHKLQIGLGGTFTLS